MVKLLFLSALIFMITAFSVKEVTWVAIGDSITYLNDHVDETGNRITKGYMTRVVEKLPNIRYINKGYNGWTSGGIAGEIEKLELIKADVYSVFLGTNDWWQGRQIGTFADYKNNTGNHTVYGSFRIIINKLHNLNSQAEIILITPMQRTDFIYIANLKNNAYGCYKEKNGQALLQFAEAIKTIANYEKCKFIDLYGTKSLGIDKLVKFKRLKDPATGEYRNYPYPHFINIPFNPETDEYPYPISAIGMTYDGLHPSDNAYAIIALLLIKALK